MTSKRFLVGIDGGGTKTACMIADFEGNNVGGSYTGGSNHQIYGLPKAIGNVCESIDIACKLAGASVDQLAFVFLGMAGADMPEDFDLLNEGLIQALGSVPFEVVNDSWIAFSSASGAEWGAISVCGTGNNLAVREKDGTTRSMRALRYMLGNYGGGNHLAEMALHYAFRFDEGTGSATKLTEVLPSFCNCESMDELAKRIYQSNYRYQKDFNIPKLVFDLAHEGDSIALHLVQKMGVIIGEMLGRMIVDVGLANEEVPVVLSGSQYEKDKHNLLRKPMTDTLLTFVPKAFVKLAQSPPVYGALMSAYSKLGISLPNITKRSLQERAEQIFFYSDD